MKTFLNYEELDIFQIIQITKFFGRIRLNLIYDLKEISLVYNITNKKSEQPIIIKKFRLLINILNKELRYIKKIHGDKEEFEHLYFYFPN